MSGHKVAEHINKTVDAFSKIIIGKSLSVKNGGVKFETSLKLDFLQMCYAKISDIVKRKISGEAQH